MLVDPKSVLTLFGIIQQHVKFVKENGQTQGVGELLTRY